MTEEQRDMLLIAALRYSRDGYGRRIREQANMRQQDMAKRVGVDPSALWRWEHGKRRPRDDAAIRWAQQLMRLELASARVESAA
jgi:transcriptional regulator with XRE-family HTH domain